MTLRDSRISQININGIGMPSHGLQTRFFPHQPTRKRMTRRDAYTAPTGRTAIAVPAQAMRSMQNSKLKPKNYSTSISSRSERSSFKVAMILTTRSEVKPPTGFLFLLPVQRTSQTIVRSEQLKVEDIDQAAVVQICCGGRRGVVVDADGQRIQLVDHAVPIDIARREGNCGHGHRLPVNNGQCALGIEIPFRRSDDSVVTSGDGEVKAAIRLDNLNSNQTIMIQADGHWLVSIDLSDHKTGRWDNRGR